MLELLEQVGIQMREASARLQSWWSIRPDETWDEYDARVYGEPMFTGITDVAHWEFDNLHDNIAKVDAALQAFKAAGGRLVWVKATQGKDYIDPSWAVFRDAVLRAGLLLGAYHFGSNTATGDVEAAFFLKTVAGATKLLCLDFEPDPKVPSRTMTTDGARAFGKAVFKSTGRYPVLYSGEDFLQHHVSGPHDELGLMPLWIAAYGPTHPRVPPCWETYDIFQYTDGTFGPPDESLYPRKTPGFGRIDRSLYNGTAEQLEEWCDRAGLPPSKPALHTA